MKKLIFLLIVILLLCGCTRRKQSSKIEVGSFSYTEVCSYYAGDPGVKESGFKNTEEIEIKNVEQVIELAKNECTVEYDMISVSYDADSNIYMVSFGKEGWTGGESVFIDQNGVTVLIIYGE